MQIEKMSKTGEFASVSVDGAVVTIGAKVYDVAALQKEEEVIIEIKEDGSFVACLILPCALFDEVEGEEDAMGEISMVRVMRAPDMDRVRVVLWALEEKIDIDTMVQGE